MTRKPPPGLFITGTDTDVGKTYVAALIAKSLVAVGHRVGVYKPVASGCEKDCRAVLSSDALTLWEAAGQPGDVEQVCPQRFLMPVAPHLAAAAADRTVDAKLLRSGLDYWLERSDIVLVEGVGGLLSPITTDEYVADLAIDLGLPLVIVARNKIGVINQVLQTSMVAAGFASGLSVAAVVLNDPEPNDEDLSRWSNRSELEQRLSAPAIVELGWLANQFKPDVDWAALARLAESHDG